MNGRDYDSAVSRYLDGEMSPTERETFELRVAGDRELARTVEAERLIRTAAKIDRSRYLSPSATSAARFEQLVRAIPKRPPMASYLRWLLGGSGLTVVAVIVLLLTASPERSPAPASPSGMDASGVDAPAAVHPSEETLPAYRQAEPPRSAEARATDTARNDSNATTDRGTASRAAGTRQETPAATDGRNGAAARDGADGVRPRAAARADSTHSEKTQMEIKVRTPEIKQNP